MFRKAQMKLFAIITAILVAVFIAVLGSINLSMKAVMQKQSMTVLKQIAAGVEYDDRTSTFTFTPPEGSGFRDENRYNEPPVRPDDKPDKVETTTKNTEETTAEKTTEPATEKSTEASSSVIQTSVPQPTTAITAQTTTAVITSVVGTRPPETATTQVIPPEKPPVHTETNPTLPSVPERPDWEGEIRPPFPPGKDNGWWEDDKVYPPFYPYWDENWNYDWYNWPEYEKDEFCDEKQGDSSMQTSCSLEALYGGVTMLSNAPDIRDGERPAEPVPKSLGTIDFFVIMADENGQYLATLNNDEIESDVAQNYITAILDDGAESGMLNNYQFYKTAKRNGTLMVFTDKSAEIDMLRQLIRTTIVIGIISFILLSVAAYFLSKKIIQPIKTAFDKQKQFISDASHELKTPLTVISANADVLSGEIGDNKWLDYIKSQTERMNILVNDLLNLTRLENNAADFICAEFNLSKAVVNTALPFECQAFEMNKRFEIDVDEGLFISGSERHIKQMAAIFIDNALKYSGENGAVRVSLKKQGDKKIFSVYNTGKGVKEDEKDKIFERFYRSDDSRSRATGGYGLGLAIAKSIIDKHKFRVNVENEEGRSICFVVTM